LLRWDGNTALRVQAGLPHGQVGVSFCE
jgi:hypothetical protein